ncbi:MAG: cytidine deaminase [Planctomycetes bacterium]|nr:cytidine deaminase [Planctomycetota bacterium]
MDLDALVLAALAARDRAYAPYSGFRVGAALLCASGRIHAAANVESASYGLTVCAERNAIARAVFEGDSQIVAVAVTADCDRVVTPCGACRQVLSEFAGPDLVVVMTNTHGKREVTTLGALLPHAFTRTTHLDPNAKTTPNLSKDQRNDS